MDSSTLGIILVFIAALLYGPQNSLIKLTFPVIGPVNFLFITLILSVPLFIAYYLIRFKKLPKFNKDHLPDILIISFFSGISPILYFFALNYTDVKNVTFLAAVSATIVNILMGKKFLDEKIDKYLILGGFLAVAGSLMISTNGMIGLPSIGDFMVIFAIIADSIRNTVSKKYFKKKSVHEATFIQVVGSGIVVGILLLPFISPDNFLFNPLTISTILYVSFIGAVVAKTFFLTALNKIGLGKISLIFNVFLPITVSVFAYFIIGETFTNYDFIGAGLALVGIIVINLEKIKNGKLNGMIKK